MVDQGLLERAGNAISHCPDDWSAVEGHLAGAAAVAWGARYAYARADFDGRGKGGISWLVWLVYEDEIRPAGMTRYATRLEALVVAAEEGLARG